jgi:hypothetical protein
LPTGASLRTPAVLEEELPTSWVDSQDSESVDERDAGAPSPLCIRVDPTGRQVEFPPTAEVNIGRIDVANGIFPDLDLGLDGGLLGGVSRHHCKIHRQGSTYLVEDAGSANGTFLNGQRLTPYLPHVLKDGDELQLGSIKLEVTIR